MYDAEYVKNYRKKNKVRLAAQEKARHNRRMKDPAYRHKCVEYQRKYHGIKLQTRKCCVCGKAFEFYGVQTNVRATCGDPECLRKHGINRNAEWQKTEEGRKKHNANALIYWHKTHKEAKK